MKRPEGPGGGLGPPQDPPPPLCRELWGSREAARYREDSRGGLQRLVPPGACSHSCLRRAAARVLLPQGYPESVSPDYLQYQCWDALQHPDGRLGHPGGSPGRGGGRQRRHRHRGHPHLGAAGFPPKPAPVPKIARFHPKTGAPADGVGMVTRITFAWLQGTRLDCEAKQWRLAADVLNDAALVLELLAPAWPRAGPALLALAAAAKETLVNGAGLLLALVLLPLLEGRPWVTWGVVTLLLATHLGANLRALGALRLPTLNRPRLRLALGGALRGGARQGGVRQPHPTGDAVIVVPGPDEVNPREPLLPGFSTRLTLHLGAPLHRLVHSEAEFRKALECGTEDYIIVLRPSRGWVGVGLRRGAPPDAPLRACAQALLLEELLGPDLPPGAPGGAALRPLQQRLRRCPPGTVPWGVVAESSRLWRTLGPAFLRGLAAAGWETGRHLLAPDEWQLDWAGPEGGAPGDEPRPSPHNRLRPSAD
ncbi:RUS family member 1 isoform X3 [Buteo buteo]|uniref:RUS family member 1 isoform X3 n=1 Tax=Buteo buteo TaxID=30397 RepID=UPI003EBE63A6